MSSRINGDLNVTGHLSSATMSVPSSSVTNASVSGDAAIARSKLEQTTNAVYVVPLTDLRVWDAVATVLPGTSATDDLGLYTGTYGTSPCYVGTSDLKAAGSTTRYARFFLRLPAEYDNGETVTIRVYAGMITTVADTAATIDVECWENDRDNTLGGADLVTTSATTINSLTFAAKDFTVGPASLAAGDLLDVRLTMLVNDAATGTAVIGAIASVELLCDVRG